MAISLKGFWALGQIGQILGGKIDKIQSKNAVEKYMQKKNTDEKYSFWNTVKKCVWEILLRNTVWIDFQLWDKLDKFLVGQLTNVAWGRGGGQWKIIDWPGCNKEEGYTTTLVLLEEWYCNKYMDCNKVWYFWKNDIGTLSLPVWDDTLHVNKKITDLLTKWKWEMFKENLGLSSRL